MLIVSQINEIARVGIYAFGFLKKVLNDDNRFLNPPVIMSAVFGIILTEPSANSPGASGAVNDVAPRVQRRFSHSE